MFDANFKHSNEIIILRTRTRAAKRIPRNETIFLTLILNIVFSPARSQQPEYMAAGQRTGAPECHLSGEFSGRFGRVSITNMPEFMNASEPRYTITRNASKTAPRLAALD